MPSNENSQVKTSVASLIQRAHVAQQIYNDYDQAQVDEVVTAIGRQLSILITITF